MWKNFSKQFEFEIEAYENLSLTQKDNYNKITKDFNQTKPIDELTDYDISRCKFNLTLKILILKVLSQKRHSLDYLCEIEISKKYDKMIKRLFLN